MENKYLDSYIYYVAIEKNLSEGTVDSYKKELIRFFDYLKERHNIDAGVDMVDITENDDFIKSYLFYLVNDKKNEKTTINRKITTLRNFFNYIVSHKSFEEIKTSPMFGIKNQKVDIKLPIYLTIEECEKFLYGIKFFSRYAVRDYAIFQVFLSTGARLSEITNLTLDQVNLKNGIIKIYGKGNKEREVSLTDEALHALTIYLNNGIRYKKDKREKIKDISKSGRLPQIDTNVIFLSKYGKPFTPKGIYMLFKSLAQRTGIYKVGLSPHKLRHTYLTLLHQEGMDIMELQKLAGHSSLKSTEIYTHVSSNILERSKNMHPLNRNSIDDDMIERIKSQRK